MELVLNSVVHEFMGVRYDHARLLFGFLFVLEKL